MAVWQDESILSGCVVGPVTAQAKYSFDRSLDNSVLKDSFGRSTGFRHELLCSVSCCYVTVLLSVLSFFSNDADTSSTPHGLNDHVKVPSTVSVQLRRENSWLFISLQLFSNGTPTGCSICNVDLRWVGLMRHCSSIETV